MKSYLKMSHETKFCLVTLMSFTTASEDFLYYYLLKKKIQFLEINHVEAIT